MITTVLDRCSELGFQPYPTTIITEQAAIITVTSTLDTDIQSKGRFYHLTQSLWRKVQQLGLVTHCRSDEEVKLFYGMLDGMVLLPVSEVPQGFQYLKAHTPEGLEPLINYFDARYVSGSYCRIPHMKMRCIPL